MRYGCQIWEQTRNQHVSDVKLQKKAMRTVNFLVTKTHQESLYSMNLEYYLSFNEIVNLQNCILVSNVLNNEVPKACKNFSKLLPINTITTQVRAAYHNKLNLSQDRTTNYGLQSIKHKSAKAWNEIQTKISDKLNIGYWSKNRL